MREFGKATPGGFLSNFFPFRGHAQTLDQAFRAAQGVRPWNDFGAYSVTGDRVQASEMRDFLRAFEGMGTRNQIAGGPLNAGAPQPSFLPGSLSPNGGAAPVSIERAGVSDTARVYNHPTHGYPVYDSTNKGKDGKVPTHRLDVPSGRAPDETWEAYEARVHSKKLTDFNPSDLVPDRSLQSLDTDVQAAAAQLIQAAQAEGYKIEVNETYRPQSRQELLFKFGRSLPGGIVTWTLTSNHATRRAIDFRMDGDNSGTSSGYQWLQREAPKYGFAVMSMSDPGHVAMPLPPQQQAGAGGFSRAQELRSLLGGARVSTTPSGAVQ